MAEAMLQVSLADFLAGRGVINLATLTVKERVAIVQDALNVLPDLAQYRAPHPYYDFTTLSKALDLGASHRDTHRFAEPRKIPLESIGHKPGTRFWILYWSGDEVNARSGQSKTDGHGNLALCREFVVVLSKLDKRLYVLKATWKPETYGSGIRYVLAKAEFLNEEHLGPILNEHPGAVFRILDMFSAIAKHMHDEADAEAKKRKRTLDDLNFRLQRLRG